MVTKNAGLTGVFFTEPLFEINEGVPDQFPLDLEIKGEMTQAEGDFFLLLYSMDSV